MAYQEDLFVVHDYAAHTKQQRMIASPVDARSTVSSLLRPLHLIITYLCTQGGGGVPALS